MSGRVRLYLWVLLLVLTLVFVDLGSTLNWIGRGFSFAVPGRYILCLVALLMTAWRPHAFGLKPGNHRKVWWIYLACGGAYLAYDFLIAPFEPALFGASYVRPSMYLLTPFSEELLFRGFMYGVLVDMYPSSEASRKWISKPVLLTALLFGLWHFRWIGSIGWGWGLAQVGGTFLAGLVMGYVRRRSGSVLGPFVMHAAWNFMATL
jgi:membrane protease YdiL (CAAX protease family)